MADLQGFYKIENGAGGVIGLDKSNANTNIPIVKVNASDMSTFSVTLAPGSSTYFISVIGTPRGLLKDQLYVTNNKGALSAQVLSEVRQKWFIQKAIDGTSAIFDANSLLRWELQNGSDKVLCQDWEEGRALNKTSPALWKLTRVSQIASSAVPLKSGQYTITNVKNGNINATIQAYREANVVSAKTPANWQITRFGGFEYKIEFIKAANTHPAITYSYYPANDHQDKLILPKTTAVTADTWLIHPLQLPDTYMIFRADQSHTAIHWLLSSSTEGTQVSVKSESADDSANVKKKLTEVLTGNLTLAEQFGHEDAENPDPEDCFWEIKLVSADDC